MLNFVHAQLDNVHYLQPIIFSLYSSATITEEYIYVSTPSTANITVTVRMADGVTIPKLLVTNINTSVSNYVSTGSIVISNSNPVRLSMVDASNIILNPGNSPLTLPTSMAGTIIPADSGGLLFQSNDKFFVNYRGRSGQQAGSVLTKGKAALGKNFFWAGTPNEYFTAVSEIGNMASIMAAENNTVITVSNIDSGTEFIDGVNSTPLTGTTITRTLQKGQSFILYAKVKTGQLGLQDTGWLGSQITSNKNITVTVGGLMQQGGIVSGNSTSGRDFAVDQLVPVERIGSEYVVMQGNGDIQERVIVVATQANTTVSINGSSSPNYTLPNLGDYQIVPASFFVNKNMYLKTNKPVYVFHKIYGDSNATIYATNSFMFIPPLSCYGQTTVDMIPDGKRIGTTQYSNTQLAVLASVSSPPIVTVDGNITNPITGEGNIAVPGNSNWTSYRYDIANATGGTAAFKNIKISSMGTIQAELIGANGNAGFGGYYSGFGISPAAEIIVTGSTIPSRPCTGDTGNSTLSVAPDLGTYQWYKDNIAIPGATHNTYSIPVTDTTIANYNVIINGPGGCLVYSNVVRSYRCPCYKPGITGTPEITKIGISTRQTASTPNFPADKNNGFIALESNNKGMVITRIPNPETSISNPVNGMFVYDTDDSCLKIYDGSQWTCINQTCN